MMINIITINMVTRCLVAVCTVHRDLPSVASSTLSSVQASCPTPAASVAGLLLTGRGNHPTTPGAIRRRTGSTATGLQNLAYRTGVTTTATAVQPKQCLALQKYFFYFFFSNSDSCNIALCVHIYLNE